MLIKEKEEKEQAFNALRGWLISKGTNLKRLCDANGLDAGSVRQKLTRGIMEVDYANSIIHLVDLGFNLEKMGSTWTVKRR